MRIVKKYIGILLLVLAIIPIADKARDEYSYLNEAHCGDVSTHYCSTEHQCEVCETVLSSGSDVPNYAILRPLSVSLSLLITPLVTLIYHAPVKGIPCLRGPPEC